MQQQHHYYKRRITALLLALLMNSIIFFVPFLQSIKKKAALAPAPTPAARVTAKALPSIPSQNMQKKDEPIQTPPETATPKGLVTHLAQEYAEQDSISSNTKADKPLVAANIEADSIIEPKHAVPEISGKQLDISEQIQQPNARHALPMANSFPAQKTGAPASKQLGLADLFHAALTPEKTSNGTDSRDAGQYVGNGIGTRIACNSYQDKVGAVLEQAMLHLGWHVVSHAAVTATIVVRLTINKAGKLVGCVLEKASEVPQLNELVMGVPQTIRLFPPIPDALHMDRIDIPLVVRVPLQKGMNTIDSLHHTSLPS